MNVAKHAVYTFHALFVATTLLGWVVYPPTGILMPLVGLLWDLNENQCLLTQLETAYFGRAIIPGEVGKISRLVLWLDICCCFYCCVLF